MKALLLQESGSPYKLELSESKLPEPAKGEVRIKTKAVSLNPVDYKFAKNGHFLEKPHILGIDIAGIIDKTGPEVHRFKAGDAVFGLLNLHRHGSFAEYAVADEHALCHIPEGLGFRETSTIPCAGITAWQALFRKSHLLSGQNILITAGGGGVGGFAIQLAKNYGLNVLTTSSTEQDHVRKLGADVVIDYTREDIVEKTMEATKGKGVHHVIDLVSSDSAESLLPVLRHNGSLVCIAGRVDMNSTAKWAKAISFHEVALGFAYQHGDTENLKDIAHGGAWMAEAMKVGTIDPMITKTISLDKIPAALSELETGHVKGKIVVQFD
ncbi:zinc-binding dehydrogenase [Balneolaceae bacterium ANBcel3]|nr:zinc-binding dehydrogenase [Balneolaceae bacterium ANBcel3]